MNIYIYSRRTLVLVLSVCLAGWLFVILGLGVGRVQHATTILDASHVSFDALRDIPKNPVRCSSYSKPTSCFDLAEVTGSTFIVENRSIHNRLVNMHQLLTQIQI